MSNSKQEGREGMIVRKGKGASEEKKCMCKQSAEEMMQM